MNPESKQTEVNFSLLISILEEAKAKKYAAYRMPGNALSDRAMWGGSADAVDTILEALKAASVTRCKCCGKEEKL